MTNSASRISSPYDESRHPLTAAMLSILPGLGQLYVGERRKGIIFLDVTAANAILLWLMLCNEPMIRVLTKMGTTFHFRLNDVVMDVLRHMHMGSPASLLFVALTILFFLFAARDAYDRAFGLRRNKLYPEFAMELSEATSGSYIGHLALMLAFAILSLFFIMPRPTIKEVTSVTILDLEHFDQRITKSAAKDVAAVKASVAQGHKRATLGQSSAKSSEHILHRAAESASSRPAPNPMPRPLTASNPAPNPILRPLTASNPAPNPMPRPLTASNPAPNPMRSISGTKLVAMNIPAPRLPAAMSSSAESPALPQLPPGSSIGHNTAMPLPAVGVSAVPRSLFPSGVQGPTSMATKSGRFAPPLLPSGTSGTNGTSQTAPSPVAVRTDGGDGARASGGPSLAPVSSHRPDPSGTGSSTGHSPSHVAPSYGNDVISITPSVGGHPRSADSTIGGGKQDVNNQPDSTECRSVDFSSYMVQLQRRIKRHWFPPHGPAARRVVVHFTVARDGTMSDLQIARSAGNSVDDQAALQAVQTACPLPSLPEGAPESVQIEFTFDYKVLSGGVSGLNH